MTNAEQPMDHVPPDDGVAHSEPSDLEKNVKTKSTWLRLLFMVVIGVTWSIAVFVTGAVIIVNFFYVLFTGKSNNKLTEFGQSLATYLYQVARYMTFNTETRPFPIDEDWPAGEKRD
jgi:uncharacterized protein YqhQ